MKSRARSALALAVSLIVAGCSPGVDTSYGRSRSTSINGTGALAGMVRDGGHEVRAAVRLSDELSDWADVLVRFSPVPGPPPRDEAKWYADWLNHAPGRRVIYVPHDYDSAPEYWARVLEQLPKDAPSRLRERVEEARDLSKGWDEALPSRPEKVAAAEDWFATKPFGPDPGKKPGPAPAAGKPKGRGKAAGSSLISYTPIPEHVCKTIGGPWASGIDAGQAGIPVREVLKVDSEEVLLKGDGEAIAMSWTRFNDCRVLVVANGSFLLNASLAANPARRPLAKHVVDWAGYSGEEDEGTAGLTVPKRVAFVEGAFVLSGDAEGPSVFRLLGIDPFGRFAAQLLALGLVACLARAPRLGRPRTEEPSGVDRPVAHPEALGALLARTGQAREARLILESYRRWRTGPSTRGGGKEGG